MNKTLLILAATLYQVPFIMRAKTLGFRVITADNQADNPGHELADRSYFVDTTDIPGVIAVARKEQVNGVLAACTDVALFAAAAVADTLGLPGPPRAAVETVCDKIVFRKWQYEHGLPAPETVAPTAQPNGIFTRSWWILKPDRSSGSKGIFIVRSVEELRDRLPKTLGFSPNSRAILEQFLPGHQISCEGILANGQIVTAWITDRQVPAPPYVVTTGHHVPTVLTSSQQTAVYTAISESWNRLRVTEGPFDCDAVVNGQDVYILEMTPRVGGNSISRLLKTAYEFDIVDYAVRQAVGDAVPILADCCGRPAGLCILGVTRSGILQYHTEELARLRDEPWVAYLKMDDEPGRWVDAFINGRHRLGEAIVLGRDRNEVDARVLELKARLQLRTT
jgi:biotin carboxylase